MVGTYAAVTPNTSSEAGPDGVYGERESPRPRQEEATVRIPPDGLRAVDREDRCSCSAFPLPSRPHWRNGPNAKK